jgi:Cu(I)/Ag(I) efflux system membrane fusion protein
MSEHESTIVVGGARRRNALIAAAAVALTLASGTAGYLLNGRGGAPTSDASGRRILYWYDPMVPQERYPGPGKSSMNMDLIPKYADEAQAEGVRVSPAMTQNLGIRLVTAEMRDLAPTLRVVGRVELDERLIAEVQTLTPGFVESLAVRAVGEPVAQGRLIATVYSPELLTAQHEYKAVLAMPRGVGSPGLRHAARNRLRLLGLPPASIQRLERGGAPQRTYPVVARASGIVTQIGARPGAQVAPGQSIVTIAGLSRVLVVAEVPEAMLGQVRVGLPVQVAFPAYAGEVRPGRIDYIYPQLNTEARTARARITLVNPGGRLRAGMFANVTVQGTGGSALVVPSEAVIDTGRRKVVIVRRNEAFLPVEVRTGRELGEWTQILSGVQRGDQVVASGQFLIDSEASLSGFIARMGQGNQAAPAR